MTDHDWSQSIVPSACESTPPSAHKEARFFQTKKTTISSFTSSTSDFVSLCPVMARVARYEIRKSGKFQNFFPKSWINPERLLRVSFDHLKCIFFNQIINNVIPYFHRIHLNGTIENTHQNIVNSINKELPIIHSTVNLHVVF